MIDSNLDKLRNDLIDFVIISMAFATIPIEAILYIRNISEGTKIGFIFIVWPLTIIALVLLRKKFSPKVKGLVFSVLCLCVFVIGFSNHLFLSPSTFFLVMAVMVCTYILKFAELALAITISIFAALLLSVGFFWGWYDPAINPLKLLNNPASWLGYFSIPLFVLMIIVFASHRFIKEISTLNIELHSTNKKLKQLSMTDSLTGLYNRRALMPVIESEMERINRFGGTASLMIIDLDHFKNINDRYGHHVGDQVLSGVASDMKNLLRSSDSISRWGGEEFIIFTTQTQLENAVLLANKIRHNISVKNYDEINGVTVSIGVAEYSKNENFEELYHRADEALYFAKNNGRNRVESLETGQEYSSKPQLDKHRLHWGEKYQSNNQVVDDQHQNLFDFANELLDDFFKGTSKGIIDNKMDSLIVLFSEHFSYEEKLLREIDYSKINEHKNEHKKLMSSAMDLITQYKNGKVAYGELYKFVSNDLVSKHILKHDIDFFPLISESL